MSSWLGQAAGLTGDSVTPGPDQLGTRTLQGPGQNPCAAAVPRQMLLRTQVTSHLPEKRSAVSLETVNPKGRNNVSCIYCGPETDKNVVFSPPLAFSLWFFLIVFLKYLVAHVKDKSCLIAKFHYKENTA